jgi:D-glycero-D-manno-heptose 1,7-bisphosphate phosphatase
MFEKALAKFNIETEGSWMIGDKERDLIPAKMLGLNTALIGEVSSDYAKYNGNSLEEIVNKYIIG